MERFNHIEWREHYHKLIGSIIWGGSSSVCFLCLRAFSAKAMRLKMITWYIMYHILSLYIKSQTPGTRLYLAVLGCTWLNLAVLGWTCLNLTVLCCSWLYQGVLGCTWLNLAVYSNFEHSNLHVYGWMGKNVIYAQDLRILISWDIRILISLGCCYPQMEKIFRSLNLD